MNFSMLMILFGLSQATLLRRLQGDLLCQSGQIYDYPYNNGNINICQNGQSVLNYVGSVAQCHCPKGTWNENYTGKCITSCDGGNNNNNNICHSGSGQIFDVPYNNGYINICQNGKTVLNFVGTSAQCHCPKGTWNDNYNGQCIKYCASSPIDNDIICESGSGQIFDVPYNNGHVKICQNGNIVFNNVGTQAQCHCPEGTFNDNYNGKCISNCYSTDPQTNNNNLCESGSGQIFDFPYNNGNVKICQNGKIVFNNVGIDAQCHCPEGTFNDNYTGKCISSCYSTEPQNNNLCQSGSGQIFDVPYNNGNVRICQNGKVVYNYVGTAAQCHCPSNTFNDNYTGQCVNIC